MGINFAPKWSDASASKEQTADEENADLCATVQAEDADEPRLPHGWWILPFAAAGLVECYFAIDWIFAQL
jgi:hypothetical protein